MSFTKHVFIILVTRTIVDPAEDVTIKGPNYIIIGQSAQFSCDHREGMNLRKG